ncbi:type II secretion system protein GspD [Fodinibius salsisoli]|uniref:Type II and III secretion system protein n=1 Tax=Fodinibius salsisoli TaxID=2820877 RepID=A0ABT3PLI9_9BACT|nr:type II and III secretion system protein [Fodinibius salsisoli]MCW9706815.1 type II and III secretion system protein [Fodinibius salsisoli]
MPVLILAGTAGAQVNNELEREYISPKELVSLSKNMMFDEAVDLLNEYAQQYSGRFIVDRTNTTEEIGIPINNRYWKEVLQYMADVKGLQVVETPRFLEIIEGEQTGATEGKRTGKQEILKEIDFSSREVRIKAIFFEGNKRALREIGVDWSTIHNLTSRPEGLSEVLNPSSGGSGGGGGGRGGGNQTLPDLDFGNEYVEINTGAAQQVTENLFNGVLNLGEIAGSGIEVRALFKAFEANDLGKILATPEIKVLDGEEGRIQVGQDFSIKQRDFAGNVIDKFFSVGTILTVTPHIIHHGDSTFIDMVINAERSTAAPSVVSTVINKQQADSEILLLDGESSVIAGLYRTENTEIRKGVPLLKDLPKWFFGLRYLFGYNSTERIEQELVILIKASIEPTLAERRNGRLKSTQELLKEKRSSFQEDRETYKEMTKKGDEQEQ